MPIKDRQEHPAVKKLLALPQDQLVSSRDIEALGIGLTNARLSNMRKACIGPSFVRYPKRTYFYTVQGLVDWYRSIEKATSIDALDGVKCSEVSK